MNFFWLWLNSIEWIVPCWLLSLAVTGWMTIRLCHRFRMNRLPNIIREESGAAYSLGWVMTLPFYVVFVGFTTECTLLVVAKAGSVYSAYAGARTAIVWNSIEKSNGQSQARARESAQQAFVPFANGMRNAHRNVNASQANGWQEEYLLAHKEFASKPASSRYLFAKMKDSEESLLVTTSTPSKFDDDITCKVVFKYRCHVPIVGNILGKQGSDGYYYRDLISEVSLQNEGPQNDSGRLGIAFTGP